MRPRHALQPPLVLRKLVGQLRGDFTERGVIVSCFVLADRKPVAGFRRQSKIAEAIYYLLVEFLRVGELLVHKRHARNAHLQSRANPILRQITFDAIALDAFRIKDQNRRRPNRVEAFEVRRMFFDVGCEWDEALIDEVSDFRIRVGLGLQPSTCASSRGG